MLTAYRNNYANNFENQVFNGYSLCTFMWVAGVFFWLRTRSSIMSMLSVVWLVHSLCHHAFVSKPHCIHLMQQLTHCMKHILRLVNYCKNTITSTQPTFFTLTFQSLSETFIRRSLFNSSSSSCHDSDATWQEIGCTCGSACSSPRPSSRTAVFLSEYVLPIWSI